MQSAVAVFRHLFTPSTTNELGDNMENKKDPFRQVKYQHKKLQLKRERGKHYRVLAKKTKKQALIDAMERARLEEYAMYTEKPLHLLGMNFLIGLARGLGMTIGLALVLALIVFVAQEIIAANLPGISKWVADFLGLVKSYSITGLPYND